MLQEQSGGNDIIDRLRKAYDFLLDDGRLITANVCLAALTEIKRLRGELANSTNLDPKHIRAYHEDYGAVLWWTRPVDEPPYVGSPLCDDWPGYHQWWTPLPAPPHKLCRKEF